MQRIKAARLVWLKLHRQLPRLGLSLTNKGRILKATVIASLLYNCEVRFFQHTDYDNMRKFINRCIRGLTWKPNGKCGLKNMKGVSTMTDLRLSMSLDDVEVLIFKRQAGYLGHLARYEKRLECGIFGMSLQQSRTLASKNCVLNQY